MEIEISQDIDFEITCDDCGSDLEISREDFKGSTVKLRISPCRKCLDREKDKGYDEGIKESD